MLKNYFTIAWRNILRSKGYSIINISGVAIGMVSAILIGLWVVDEINYNKSFEKYDRLAHVYHHITFGEETLTIPDVPAPLGEVLINTYAEFEETTVTSGPADHILAYNDTKISESGLFVGPAFTSMFSIAMVEGMRSEEIHSVTIAKSLASALLSE